MRNSWRRRSRGLGRSAAISTVLLVAASLASCGGAGGGPGPDGSGQGLTLVSFAQDSLDNVSLNEVLLIVFSEPLDPASVTLASVQVREGGAFGLTVDGELMVSGSTLEFRPRLPGLCDRSDSGFKPATSYRVQLVGHPEEFSLRNTRGQPLDRTSTMEFETLPDTDPNVLRDAVPGAPPSVVTVSPANGTVAAAVAQGNRVVLTMSENIDPCSVDETTVLFHEYERGEQFAYLDAGNGRDTGFDSITDLDPSPFSWGAGNSTAVAPPQRVPSYITVEQDFDSTQIIIEPVFGEFPDNALLVVELTSSIMDFGGQLGTPFRASFTTENRPPQEGTFVLHYAGEVALDEQLTTADVDTPRAPSRAQGYLLFAGDGDNGGDPLSPTLPNEPPFCTLPRQSNDGTLDHFDPDMDVLLDTGASGNTCDNGTDGSKAVVWEFASFRIRGGVTVRIVGRNPAILLVSGDVFIEQNGRLLARGDANGGSPRGDGTNGSSTSSAGNKPGGRGTAGGGEGGIAYHPSASKPQGQNGFSGFGSDDYDANMVAAGIGDGGQGAGIGGVPDNNSDTFGTGASQGAGGAGHATPGLAGQGNPGQNVYGSVHSFIGALRGNGGGVYPNGSGAERMLQPSAGSGGGGAGDSRGNNGTWDSLGGSGAAGGGFVDITSNGSIRVFGTIDASGGRGGNGYYDASFTATGGGGGGAGGGVRLLTPFDINLTGGTLTAAGGSGGTAASPTNKPNVGGAGGNGRIVLEDGDSVITGQGAAAITPAEGATGFYRGIFDAGRFQGGGLQPGAQTVAFFTGPRAPTFIVPEQNYAGTTHFAAGIPEATTRGVGKTGILIEMQGYPILPDGSADMFAPTGWYTIGHFVDSGVPNQPTWMEGANPPPADVLPPAGNVGAGIAALNGSAVIEVRVTFYLPTGVGPFDAGPFVDRWDIRFSYDQ